ncbi:hypothetical protein ACWD4P_12725 [Kitasatospora sp. NPDC002543]
MTRALTAFEADVLRYRTQGYRDYEIARALSRTERDVRNAVLRAVRALGAHSLDHAIQIHNQPTPKETTVTKPRLFHLQRDTDITGISGTGIVAHGVQWPDGTVTIRWTGDMPSTVNWTHIDHATAVHGHGGHTRIIWTDGGDQ